MSGARPPHPSIAEAAAELAARMEHVVRIAHATGDTTRVRFDAILQPLGRTPDGWALAMECVVGWERLTDDDAVTVAGVEHHELQVHFRRLDDLREG